MDRASVSETEGCGFESHQVHMKNRLIIILDNIRSVLNVGSILRTAEAVGAEVWFCGITPTPDHPRIAKTALGAENLVKWRAFKSVGKAVAMLNGAKRKINDVKIYAIETVKNAKNHYATKYPENVALIFGHEVLGVDSRSLNVADDVLKIPMIGKKESLNVAVAVGVVSYEVIRQWSQNNNGRKRGLEQKDKSLSAKI